MVLNQEQRHHPGSHRVSTLDLVRGRTQRSTGNADSNSRTSMADLGMRLGHYTTAVSRCCRDVAPSRVPGTMNTMSQRCEPDQALHDRQSTTPTDLAVNPRAPPEANGWPLTGALPASTTVSGGVLVLLATSFRMAFHETWELPGGRGTPGGRVLSTFAVSPRTPGERQGVSSLVSDRCELSPGGVHRGACRTDWRQCAIRMRCGESAAGCLQTGLGRITAGIGAVPLGRWCGSVRTRGLRSGACRLVLGSVLSGRGQKRRPPVDQTAALLERVRFAPALPTLCASAASATACGTRVWSLPQLRNEERKPYRCRRPCLRERDVRVPFEPEATPLAVEVNRCTQW